jgi:hypothetical protein
MVSSAIPTQRTYTEFNWIDENGIPMHVKPTAEADILVSMWLRWALNTQHTRHPTVRAVVCSVDSDAIPINGYSAWHHVTNCGLQLLIDRMEASYPLVDMTHVVRACNKFRIRPIDFVAACVFHDTDFCHIPSWRKTSLATCQTRESIWEMMLRSPNGVDVQEFVVSSLTLRGLDRKIGLQKGTSLVFHKARIEEKRSVEQDFRDNILYWTKLVEPCPPRHLFSDDQQQRVSAKLTRTVSAPLAKVTPIEVIDDAMNLSSDVTFFFPPGTWDISITSE